jgi:hypothetical protein
MRRVVDLLPERLWAPGNLMIPPIGEQLIGRWHFCVGSDEEVGHAVRTIERKGRQVARGLRPFNCAVHGTDV